MLKVALLFFVCTFALYACQPAPSVTPTQNIIISTIRVATQPVISPTTVAEPIKPAETSTSGSPYPYPQVGISAYPGIYPYPLAGEFVDPGAYPAPAAGQSGSNATQQYPAPPTLNPADFKTSQPGTATVHGYLLVTDPMQSRPTPDDGIFLVPLAGEGVMSIPPFKVGDVPEAEVNEMTGEFSFADIKPGRYAVVVLTVGDAQIPAHLFSNKSIAIVNVKDTDLGKTIELEYIFI
jgi:hypothetical protein